MCVSGAWAICSMARPAEPGAAGRGPRCPTPSERKSDSVIAVPSLRKLFRSLRTSLGNCEAGFSRAAYEKGGCTGASPWIEPKPLLGDPAVG